MSENNLVISIDAMGGDNSPRVVIEGLAIAARKNPDVRFLLFGDEAKIRASLGNYPQLQKVCEIRHSDEVVRNEDKPSSVIRNKTPACTWRLMLCAKARLRLSFPPAIPVR